MGASAVKVSPGKSSQPAGKDAKNDVRNSTSSLRETGPLMDLARTMGWDRERPSMQGLAGELASMPLARRQSAVLSLQKTRGNGFVHRLAIQAKLKVGPAGDRFEREADHVADQVMRMTEQADPVQKQEAEIQTKPLASSITPLIRRFTSFITSPLQRQEDEEEIQTKPLVQRQGEEEEVQTKRPPAAGGFDAGRAFESRLSATRGGGRPLPDGVRVRMEAGFGADFSGVRVHTGSEAQELNRSISAQAFTHDKDIYLGEGREDLQSKQGNQLLAHELTHVLQQSGADQSNGFIRRYPATALQTGTGIDWNAMTASVFHPAEGVSGGVYFFRGTPPIAELVVKPEYVALQGEGPEEERREKAQAIASSQMADQFLRAMGLNVPDSRIVNAAEPEARDILETAKNRGQAIPQTNETQLGAPLAHLKIMGKANATSFGSAAEKADDPGKVATLIANLNNRDLMMKVGKLIVADAFMQNYDRIDVRKANVGNLMFSGTRLTAIDSNSMFMQVAERPTSSDLDQLDDLITKEDVIITSLFDGLKDKIPNQAGKDQFADYLITRGGLSWRGYIRDGLRQGIIDLRGLLEDKFRRHQLKDIMQGYQRSGAHKMSWERFKLRQRYMESRRAVVHAVARTDAMDYVRWKSELEGLIKIPDKIYKVPNPPPKVFRMSDIQKAQKAQFETKVNEFITFLVDKKANFDAATAGLTGKFIEKKKNNVRKRLPAFDGFLATLRNLAEQWITKLKPKDGRITDIQRNLDELSLSKSDLTATARR